MAPMFRLKLSLLALLPWLLLCVWIGLRWHELGPLIAVELTQ